MRKQKLLQELLGLIFSGILGWIFMLIGQNSENNIWATLFLSVSIFIMISAVIYAKPNNMGLNLRVLSFFVGFILYFIAIIYSFFWGYTKGIFIIISLIDICYWFCLVFFFSNRDI